MYYCPQDYCLIWTCLWNNELDRFTIIWLIFTLWPLICLSCKLLLSFQIIPNHSFRPPPRPQLSPPPHPRILSAAGASLPRRPWPVAPPRPAVLPQSAASPRVASLLKRWLLSDQQPFPERWASPSGGFSPTSPPRPAFPPWAVF